jgi:hypothetical protein
MPAHVARIGRVRPAPVRRLCRAAAVAAVAALVATGCGGEVKPKPAAEPTTVTKSLNWDLSRGGTIDQVRWPSQGTLFELSRGVQVNLTLPGGKAFKGRVEKVLGRREGRNLRNIELFFPAAGTDDAYARAKRLGKEWGIELGNLDEWHKRRKQQREKGKEDLSYAAFTGSGDSQPLGGSGPKPAIEVLNSFDKERPVVVNLSFLWPRPGQPR